MTKAGMDVKTFRAFCDFIYEQSGIVLKTGKEALVEARMSRRMRATGIETPAEYLRFVRNDPTGTELVHMLDAISTNLTSFFRESVHFEILKKTIGEWFARGQLSFTVWCAAASTGEEPYSIAMTILDTVGEGRTQTRILATDISTKVLVKSKEGIYPNERLATVPPAYRTRYFEKVQTPEGPMFSAKPCLREMLFFRRLNLATPPFPMRGPMDVVFCRNVMIYFDNIVRERLINEIYRLLRPGGILLVGHSESLSSLQHNFKPYGSATYRKPS